MIVRCGVLGLATAAMVLSFSGPAEASGSSSGETNCSAGYTPYVQSRTTGNSTVLPPGALNSVMHTSSVATTYTDYGVAPGGRWSVSTTGTLFSASGGCARLSKPA